MAVTHRFLLIIVGVLMVAALLGLAALWPRSVAELPAPSDVQTTELVDATLVDVTRLGEADDIGLPPGAISVSVAARIESSGQTVTFETTDDTGGTYRAGQRVRLAVIEQDGLETTYYIADFRRGPALAVLVAVFLAAVIGLGRFHGLRALVGLTATFALIVAFIVPAILAGRSPLAVAIVASLLIVTVTLYLSHGFSAKTSAAVVGTALALLLTGLLAVVFVGAANITGFASEEARLANVTVGGLSLRGLLLAGIVIGGLGVLDDVTMTQASTVFELRRANARAGFRELFTGAMAVGRDHVAATVNTLFLAYAGAALPLLILFATGTDPFGTVVTSETVAVEIVRTLVGSIGLIAAVPLTSALAAAVIATGATSDAQEMSQRDSETSLLDPFDDESNDWISRLREAYRLPPSDTEKERGRDL